MYTECWGHSDVDHMLLFVQESQIHGVIVLELCQVESEAFSGNRNAFRLSMITPTTFLTRDASSNFIQFSKRVR